MRKYWFVLLLPALLLLWWALDRRDAVVTVHVATAVRGRIESTVPTNGKVEPVEWAAARAEAAGVVRSVAVQRGQTVKARDTLVTLDATAPQSDLATAIAHRQEAQAQLAMLDEGGKASQIASLDSSILSAQSAVDVADRNYQSEQHLAAQNAATKLSVQQAKDSLNRATQQLEAYKGQRRTLVTASDKAVAQARLRDAEAAVALAQHRVVLSTIRAPMNGSVYQFDLKVGAYLQPGDTVALVGDVDQMKVAVYVDEPDLGRIAAGRPVAITWEAHPGKKWWGHVEKLPTEVITLGTRTVGEVSTVIDNPDHDLLPGVTVNATIISKVATNALMIPKAALRNVNGKNGTYRLSATNALQWVPVEAGISDINNVQILSGLQAGDRVIDRVVDPSDAEMNPGMRVRVTTD